MATSRTAMPEPLPNQPADQAQVDEQRPQMERLSFTLPDFTRVSWVSDRAREVWAPRLERIINAWLEIEWRAVVAGVRRCAIATAAPEEFIALAPGWADVGLTGLPLEMMGTSSQLYSSTAVEVEPGQPFVFRFVVGRSADVTAFKQAWDDSDQEAIGDLLGYPPCCREFFRRVWVDDGMNDTTWPMAVASGVMSDDGTAVDVSGPPEANLLWRWMGSRAVPHLPCSFECTATAEFGRALIAVGRESGFGQEMDWLLEVLSWPVEWSALHGIAEIKTPILKVSSRTDATARRYVVRRDGDDYPEEGVEGLGFPFRAPVKLRITGARGFRRGIENVVTLRPVWYSADNGFRSLVEMDQHHEPVVAAAVEALSSAPGPVLDLGCGNGALLAKIVDAVPGVEPFGVDTEGGPLEHALELHPDVPATNFVEGDLLDGDGAIWDTDRRFALAIVMPGRMTEVGTEAAAPLLARLRERCDQVLVYTYALDGFEDLGEMAGAAGLVVRGDSQQAAAIVDIVTPARRGPLGGGTE